MKGELDIIVTEEVINVSAISIQTLANPRKSFLCIRPPYPCLTLFLNRNLQTEIRRQPGTYSPHSSIICSKIFLKKEIY